MGLCDSHAHLSYVAERKGAAFLQELEAAYAGADGLILDPGVDYDDFPARKAAFGPFPFVRLAAGIWPDTASIKAASSRVAALENHVRDDSCSAVGECGLDYHWMNGTPDEQAFLFRAQAELAVRYGKPLIVHSREAHDDTLAVVKEFVSRIPVVIHCFGYGPREAADYIRLGCSVSFAGNLTYKKSEDLRAACALVPDGLLLLETDSPYMCPEPSRGKDSSPLDISRTYDLAADLRGASAHFLAGLVLRNARALFG